MEFAAIACSLVALAGVAACWISLSARLSVLEGAAARATLGCEHEDADDGEDGADIDYDNAMRVIAPPPHEHVWPPENDWFAQDETSRSYRCQVPRCQRVYTQMMG